MSEDTQSIEINEVTQTKQFRKDLDAVLQRLKSASKPLKKDYNIGIPHRVSRERSLAVTKIQEAIMWLGMDLKAQREEGADMPAPYPASYDPNSTVIEPPADRLKL